MQQLTLYTDFSLAKAALLVSDWPILTNTVLSSDDGDGDIENESGSENEEEEEKVGVVLLFTMQEGQG